MLLPSYLRRSRHGIFYIRLVMPPPIAVLLGQREFLRSLGTRSFTIAKTSGYQVSLRIKPLLERLKRVMAIDPNSFNLDDVRKLIIEGLDFKPDGSVSVNRIETNPDPLVAAAEMRVLNDTAAAWHKVHDFTSGMNDSEFELRKADAQRLHDEMVALSSPVTVASRQPISKLPPGITIPLRPATLQACFDSYTASKKRISQSAKESYQESFELFATLMGGEHRMAHEIHLLEFKEFGDALAHIPAHAKKRGIQLRKAAEILASPPELVNRLGQPIDTISGKTANGHLTNLQSFFDYVASSGRRDGDNPFLKLMRHSDGQQSGGADGFDEHELRAIFDPAMLMQAKRPTQFWAPLLALYTGARLNEIACLDLADFVEEKGIRCIAIRHVPRATPDMVEHRRNIRSTKNTKNLESRRLVPLHPDLFEIGIDTYIEDLRTLGANRLFPTCPKDVKGKRERRLSHDGNEYLKKVGVYVLRQKVMHSFRDTVCEMLSVQDMDDVRADQWTGHKNQSIKGRHYRRSKAAVELQAKEGFDALNFPFIDLEGLQYRKGWWNDFIAQNMTD